VIANPQSKPAARAIRPLRIAFVAPIFVTEDSTGGLASYLNKITQALLRAGHHPEVFVLSWHGPSVIDHNGVMVHRVGHNPTRGWLRWCQWVPNLKGFRQVREAIQLLTDARQLALAFEARDRQAPFDMVQSTDLSATGLSIRPRPGRPHLVRCSNPIDLYIKADGERLHGPEYRLQLRAVRRAQIAYAPSKFTADYYAHRLRRTIHVCRPPALIEHDPMPRTIEGLPPRYLFHFGDQLNSRKGTEWIARALPLAWKSAPDLKLVIAGRFFDFQFPDLQLLWGRDKDKVIYLGQLSKPDLLAVLRRARAAVLPSLVDNLPNAVYESLSLGIPVIGTRGASIDELVDDGITGELVEPLDLPGLAEKMAACWRGESPVRPGFKWNSPIATLMTPEVAVESLLNLAGLIPPSEIAPAELEEAYA